MRVCGHERGEIGKRRVEERKPHFVGKALAARRDGLRIPIEREQAAFSTQGLEYECRVAAAPERRIDLVTVRFQGQPGERLAGEHRCVLIHPKPTSLRGPLKRQGLELRGQIRRGLRVCKPGVATLVPARLIP